MRRANASIAALAVVLGLGVSAAPAQEQPPATQPSAREKEAVEVARIRKEREAEQARLPNTHVKSLRDAVQFSIENDDVVIRTSIPPTENSAIVVAGADGFLTIAATRGEDATASPYVPDLFRLIRHQFPAPGPGIAITQVNVIGLRVTISRTSEIDGEFLNVDLMQANEFLEEGDERVRFYVQATRDDVPVHDLKLTAINIVELRRKYPAETMRYLEPIFREFGQSPVLFKVNPRAAWQALGGAFEPPADVLEQVDALLKRLDAESPQDREAAAAALETMGQPAALALMRRDRGGMSEEQLTRVETFLAPFKPLPDEEAAKMRADPEFLLLALSTEDAALAALALEQLKAIAKQPITFDAGATGPARSDAIAKLRAQILPATTRPATTKADVEPAQQAP